MTTEQPEALRLANELDAEFAQGRISNHTGRKAATELRRQHTRIAELEAQLESIGASAGSEPVALDHIACIEDGELRYMTGRKAPSYDCELYAMPGGKSAPPLYTHPSPPEGMVGGWTKASQQLPPCRDDQLYVGINTAGFAGVFNAVADIAGNVHCMYETPEETIDVMSSLDIWQPLTPPTTSAGSGKGE